MDEKQSYGKIVVKVSSADGAIPIEGATVAVRVEDGDGTGIVAIKTTNESGETGEVIIGTPSPSLSLSPDPAAIPYSLASVEVTAYGYYSTANINVPVFPGVTTVQSVNMYPLPEGTPEGYQPPEVVIFDNGAADL